MESFTLFSVLQIYIAISYIWFAVQLYKIRPQLRQLHNSNPYRYSWAMIYTVSAVLWITSPITCLWLVLSGKKA